MAFLEPSFYVVQRKALEQARSEKSRSHIAMKNSDYLSDRKTLMYSSCFKPCHSVWTPGKGLQPAHEQDGKMLLLGIDLVLFSQNSSDICLQVGLFYFGLEIWFVFFF